MTDLSSLNLSPKALAGAQALLAAHPGAMLTSGRRGVTAQARAMASNIVHNRQWIAQTYVPTPESHSLQAWIDAHPSATEQDSIAVGLAGIMAGWTDEQKAKVSKHFSGDAFDVQPISGPEGDAIKAFLHALPGKFLEKEGGLVRWHWQAD